MPAVAFDTLKLAQRLEAAGFSARQAQDTAAALAETLTGAVATAADVAAARADLGADIRESELRLRTEIAGVRTEISGLRAELMRWMIAQTFVILGAVAALIRLLH